MANNSGSNIDIEVYEPTHCFRCHAPIYIKPDDYGVPFGEQVTLIAFDFGTGRCPLLCTGGTNAATAYANATKGIRT